MNSQQPTAADTDPPDSAAPEPRRRSPTAWLAQAPRRYYRDLTALGFFLFIYPQLTHEAHLDPESESWALFCGFWFAMALVGVIANIAKLRSLDPLIAEKKLQREVKTPAVRFLAGTIALPLLLVLPLALWMGPDIPEAWIGAPFLLSAAVLWAAFSWVGRGDPARVQGRRGPHKPAAIAATVGLLLFELFVYTLFLESFWIGEETAPLSIRTILVLTLPMSLLFFMLLLPATLGFYIEATVRYRSHVTALVVLWGRFLLFRLLPINALIYLEQQGWRLPWIL